MSQSRRPNILLITTDEERYTLPHVLGVGKAESARLADVAGRRTASTCGGAVTARR